MNSFDALWPFVMLGLMGMPHCAGMCGGFALAAARGPRGTARSCGALGRPLCYALGKSSSYAVLAALLASGCAWLGARGQAGDLGRGAGLAGLQAWLGVASGALLIALGSARLGLRLDLVSRGMTGLERSWRGSFRPLREFLRSVSGQSERSAAFCLGVANGLVPCGLSWGALALAAPLAPPLAAAGLFLFGLATAPVLLAMGLAPRWLSPSLRTRLAPWLGVALIVFGARLLLRSIPPRHGPPPAAPSCCADEARASRATPAYDASGSSLLPSPNP